MNKTARNSFGEPYVCKKEWADDCFVQCGDKGLVISKTGNYKTAFFEAFPRNPKTFIRGEGHTIEDAEQNSWNKLKKYQKCKKHEFERGSYTDGHGVCKHCGLFLKFSEPLTKCCICGKTTNYKIDNKGNFYCVKHFANIPKKLRLRLFRDDNVEKRRLPRKLKKAVKKAFIKSLHKNKNIVCRLKDVKVHKSLIMPFVKMANWSFAPLRFIGFKMYIQKNK